MATINRNLYNLFVPGNPVGQGGNDNHFLASENGGTPGQPFTPSNAGDTMVASLYFLEATPGQPTPYTFKRWPGSTVEINLFASGNSHFYAIATSTTEIVPTTGMTVTRLVAGAASAFEKQRIVFNGTPLGGTFRLFFQRGSQSSSGQNHRASFNADINVPYNITAQGLQDILNGLGTYYDHGTTGNQQGGPFGVSFWDTFGFTGRRTIVTATAGGFDIQFGSDGGGGLNTYLDTIPLIQAYDTNVAYKYGYTVSVPLTASDFAQMFLSANAPAFLDVVLRSPAVAGGAPTLTGQLPLATNDPVAPVADFVSVVTTGAAPLTVQFTDNSANTPTSWAWNFGDPASGGSNTSTSQNPSHQYVTPGLYTVQLTATNAHGSNVVVKTNYIFVVASAGSPPGIIFDDGGRFVNAEPCGDYIFDPNPLPFQANAIVARQRFCQKRVNWSKQALGTAGPNFGQASYLVDEVDFEDIGAGLMKWSRVWATKPNNFSIPVHVTKNYLLAQYTWTGTPAHVVDQGIISWTALIKGTMAHTYYLDPSLVPALPQLQILMLTKYFTSQVLSDAGTGFPTTTYPFGVGYFGNGAPSYINGVIEPYMGKMMCVKVITG